MTRRVTVSLLPALVAGVVVALAFITLGGGGTTKTRTVVEQGPVVARPAAAGGATAGDIYRRVADGVVSVRADVVESVDSPFGLPEQQQGQATGTGFVIDRQGRIVTNYHVVSGARKVTVRFGEGKAIAARVVGTDPSKDVALLRVDPGKATLHPVALGSSSSVRVGDAVLALGNPFGLDRTLTSGIVSALQRSLSAPNGFAIENVIQTDAAINPGNSGGPLLDAAGRVIGINSQIATDSSQSGGSSSSGGNVGIGFAVPIDTVKADLPALERNGKIARAWLGVRVGNAADATNPTADTGALIAGIVPGSPASRSGLRRGDVVVAVDGKPAATGDDVTSAVGNHQPGDEVVLTVQRGGDSRTEVKVRLGTQPSRAPSQ